MEGIFLSGSYLRSTHVSLWGGKCGVWLTVTGNEMVPRRFHKMTPTKSDVSEL